MIIVVLLVLLPMIHMLAVSFSSDVYVMQSKVGLWPKGFTAKTYGYVFEDDRIFRSYGNTILYTVLGTTISLSITAMGAYALSAKRMIGHKFFSMMIVFTMFFQGGMIPTYLVVKSYGLLDTIWGVILPAAERSERASPPSSTRRKSSASISSPPKCMPAGKLNLWVTVWGDK